MSHLIYFWLLEHLIFDWIQTQKEKFSERTASISFSLFSDIFIFGSAGSLMLCGLFCSCSEQGLLSSWGARASHCGGFSCCGAQALGPAGLSSWRHVSSVVEEHGLKSTGSVVVVHRLSVGSSWIRDRTRVSCVGKWILFHWAAWEAQPLSLDSLLLVFFFGLLHSLGRKLRIFCSLFHIFLSTLFLWSSTSTFVLQNTWSNRTMNLECSGPRFLTFFV